MKPQSKSVQSIKGKIATLVKLVALGAKKYIVKLIDLEVKLESAQKVQLLRKIKIQIKTGSEWHSTERRGAMVMLDGQPIYQVLKPLSQEWELVGNKGKHGKWAIAEYEVPFGAEIEFHAYANGGNRISEKFIAGWSNNIDVDGYSYNGCTCGWVVEIN